MKVYEVIVGESSNTFREKSVKLADMIEMMGENKNMKGHAHSTYNKLIYKASGIKYRKIKNGSFRQTLSAEELEKVEDLEWRVMMMLAEGLKYNEIKEGVLNGHGEAPEKT